jgi:hypothetical protein
MNEVFFRNYQKDKTWEISKSKTSMYIPYSLIQSETAIEELKIILSQFNLPDLDNIIDTLIKYTEKPQEDMFIVETE